MGGRSSRFSAPEAAFGCLLSASWGDLVSLRRPGGQLEALKWSEFEFKKVVPFKIRLFLVGLI